MDTDYTRNKVKLPRMSLNSLGDTPSKTSVEDASVVIADVARKEARPETIVVPTIQLVTFELDKEEYASIITDLREIIRIPDVTPIPGAPEFIKGILNLRGQIVVVIDLEKRFHLKREHLTEPKHIIIAEVGDSVFGITVDEVTGVMRVPETTIKATPQLITSKIHTEYLKGVVILEGEAEEVKEEEEEQEVQEDVEKEGGGGKKSTKKSKAKKVGEKVELASRLLLLLDIPKMLAEKELLEFGNVVQGTIKGNTIEVGKVGLD